MQNFKSLSFLISIVFSLSSSAQIFFSEYAEGSSYNKYIEIYNYSNETVSLSSQFVLASCTNGCIDGNNFYINEFPDGATIAPGDVYVVASNQADAIILSEADYTFQYCCGNGDDAYALMLNGATGDVFDSSNALDIIGNEDTWQEGVGWDVAGVEQATENHTLVRKSSVMEHNSGNWSMSAGTNSENSEWIVLENDDWSNLGFHVYDENTSTVFGCTDPFAENFNPIATVDDGSCEYDESILGCTDPFAENYNPDATDDDGSCEYSELIVSGCYWCEYALNYFDFIAPQPTGGNMTIAITDPIILSNLVVGDMVGVFYTDSEGFISCGGSAPFEGNSIAIAAWGDDPSTFEIDGFLEGDSFIFLVLRDGVVYEVTSILSNVSPFTNDYGNNNFGQITSFLIQDEFVENCILPLGFDDDCTEFFDIPEVLSDKKKLIVKSDLLGHVNYNNKSEIILYIYDDGTVEKKYFLNQ